MRPLSFLILSLSLSVEVYHTSPSTFIRRRNRTKLQRWLQLYIKGPYLTLLLTIFPNIPNCSKCFNGISLCSFKFSFKINLHLAWGRYNPSPSTAQCLCIFVLEIMLRSSHMQSFTAITLPRSWYDKHYDQRCNLDTEVMSPSPPN